MTTDIRSNGSKWAGQAPDDISALLGVLECHPLEGCFAPFVTAHPALSGRVTFHGNFATVSHVFRIETDDAEVIVALMTAIVLNVLRPDYVRAAPRRTGS